MSDDDTHTHSKEETELSKKSPINLILHSVIHLVNDNINHFNNDESEQGQRLYCGLRALKDGLLRVSELAEVIDKKSELYDFRPDIQGNGFRSFYNLVHQAILCVLDMCKKISSGRGSIIPFRKAHFVREVEAWGQTLASLSTVLDYLLTNLLPKCEDGNLMPDLKYSSTELLSLLNTVSQYSFYGRCLGFHYQDSLQKTMKFLNIGMCAFSEVYYSDGGFLQRTKQSVYTGSKYLMDPEQRARRIVDVVQYSSVDFIKSFWSLADTELLTQLPGIVGPTLAVFQQVMIPCEDIETHTTDGKLIVIGAPQSHLPSSPISSFLLSSSMREGMPGEHQHKGTVLPPSENILFHCHGGGFVTHSTKAQEVFLRDWAVGIDVPIFSIDYSLAPDARHPRPLEEVLTAYVWMLSNFQILGSLGNKIIFTGDSAGGNLLTALTIKCIELGIRPPDGLLLCYTPFCVKLQPTPSRLLAVLDPILPLGFVLRCLKAYAGLPSNQTTLANTPESNSTNFSSNEKNEKDSINKEEIKERLKQQQSLCDEEVEDLKPADNNCQTIGPEEDIIEQDNRNSKENEEMIASYTAETDADTMTTISLTSDPGSKITGDSKPSAILPQETQNKEELSRRYVSEFLEKYVLDSRVDDQGQKVPILRTESEEMQEGGDDDIFESGDGVEGLGAKFERAKEAVLGGISSKFLQFKMGKSTESFSSSKQSLQAMTSPNAEKLPRKPSFGRIPLGTTKLRRDSSCSLLEEFVGVKLMEDHYLNPLLAPSDTLAQFPRVSILTVEYDFCLDDCVTMARRFYSLGVDVTLDILNGLPHGFLSLNLVSKECHDGCKLAINRIKELLGEIESIERTPTS